MQVEGTLSIKMSFEGAKEYRKSSSFMPYSYFCIGTDNEGHMVSEDYAVYSGHQVSSNDEMRWYEDDNDPYSENLTIKLDSLPTSIKQILIIVNRYATENSDHIVNIVCGTENNEKRFPGIYKPETTLSACLLFRVIRLNGWYIGSDNRLVDIEQIMLENK